MTRLIRNMLFALVLAPCAIYANPTYFSLHAGMAFQDDYVVETEDQTNNLNFAVNNLTTETGTRFGLAYGVLIDTNRLELEYSHRSIGFEDSVLSNGNGDTRAASNGSVTSDSLMANILVNIGLGGDASAVYTFMLGAGAGVVLLEVDGVNTSSASATKNLSDSSAVLAYQVMLGVSTIMNREKMGLSLEYRLFISEDGELKDSVGNAITADGFSTSEIMLTAQFFTD